MRLACRPHAGSVPALRFGSNSPQFSPSLPDVALSLGQTFTPLGRIFPGFGRTRPDFGQVRQHVLNTGQTLADTCRDRPNFLCKSETVRPRNHRRRSDCLVTRILAKTRAGSTVVRQNPSPKNRVAENRKPAATPDNIDPLTSVQQMLNKCSCGVQRASRKDDILLPDASPPDGP